MTSLQAAQDLPDTGYFRANVTARGTARPIQGAKITISDINNPEDIIEELTTDADGQTETIPLQTPPLEYSMEPESNQPYSVSILKQKAMSQKKFPVPKSCQGRHPFKMQIYCH